MNKIGHSCPFYLFFCKNINYFVYLLNEYRSGSFTWSGMSTPRQTALARKCRRCAPMINDTELSDIPARIIRQKLHYRRFCTQAFFQQDKTINAQIRIHQRLCRNRASTRLSKRAERADRWYRCTYRYSDHGRPTRRRLPGTRI